MNIKNSFLVVGLLFFGQTIFAMDDAGDVAAKIVQARADRLAEIESLNVTPEQLLAGKELFDIFLLSPAANDIIQSSLKQQLGQMCTEQEGISYIAFLSGYIYYYFSQCSSQDSQESCYKSAYAFAYLCALAALDLAEKQLLNNVHLS